MRSFDVVVLGGGPGGLASGMILAMNGKSVAVVQSDEMAYGGTCLNIGCMPTKALLKSASVYRNASHCAAYGLDIDVKPVDLQKVRAVVDADLNKLRGAIKNMMSMAPSMVAVNGMGSFVSDHEIAVKKQDGTTENIHGEKIIVAVGSEPAALPFAPFDGKYILSSNDMLTNTELPEKLLIIGGGAIGCEFATIYSSFGSKVTLVEALETLLPKEDKEAGRALGAAFTAQGIDVRTGTLIENVKVENGRVRVSFKGGAAETFDKVLVGVGRRPRTDGLNLDAAGVKTDRGFILVNEFLRTNKDNIYATGDVIGGMMLAHAADRESAALAMNILGGDKMPVDERSVPRLAYCNPEVGAVGTTEEGGGVAAFTMPQIPNGRSVVDKTGPAFMKLFVEEKTKIVVGAIIIGEASTEMIHEVGLAVENRLPLESITKTVHAHPTHSKNILKTADMFLQKLRG